MSIENEYFDRHEWIKLRDRLFDLLFCLGRDDPEVRAEASYRLCYELDRFKLGWDDIADIIFRYGPLYKKQIDDAIEECRKLSNDARLHEGDREFLDVARHLDRLDDKQKRILARICRKLDVRWP
jgi:hypothetical protein